MVNGLTAKARKTEEDPPPPSHILQVSLMLEEGFAAAAALNTMGFPVGVQLASRLVPDVTHFLASYIDSVSRWIGGWTCRVLSSRTFCLVFLLISGQRPQ